MATPIKFKRRWTGTTDAPGTLLSGEPAYNGVNDIFYLGKGDDGAGNATSVQIIGGVGAFLTLTAVNQTVDGIKTFTQSPVAPTPTGGDNSTKLATTAFVMQAVSSSSIPDGNKGDITVSASGTTFTVNAASISLSKMANVAASSFLGNNTGSSATPVAMTVAQAKVLLALAKVDVGLSNVENTALSTWAGSTAITTLGTITAGTWNGSVIAVNKGGTNLTSYTQNAILFASATTTIGQIAPANNAVLVSNGSGVPSMATTLPSNLTLPGLKATVAVSISAAGTSQATATALTSDYNVVGTVAASAGVVLPASVPGIQVTVVNKGSNALSVYPPISSAIDSAAVNAPTLIPPGNSVVFECTTATTWLSSINELIAASAIAGTLPAANMPAFSGDVSTTAGQTAATITAGAVTLSKMANLAANSLIGNNTGSAATPVALTAAQVKTLLTLVKADVGLTNVDNTSDINKPVSSATQSALNLKADLALVGAANGIAPLDSGAKIPSAFLPAYVDDVLEYANVAAFPATGTSGLIYVAVDTNRIYRWSGSVYIELDPSPGSTDAVPEGSTNKYYTATRAQSDVVAASITSGDTTHAPSGGAVYTALGTKLSAASNLSDLTNAATARTNLSLGTMATQSASSVNITGGTISNVLIDGGTY